MSWIMSMQYTPCPSLYIYAYTEVFFIFLFVFVENKHGMDQAS